MYRTVRPLHHDVIVIHVPRLAVGLGDDLHVGIVDRMSRNGREIDAAVLPASGARSPGGQLAVLIHHRRIPDHAGRVGKTKTHPARHAGGNQLPHKQLLSGLNDVSVQVTDVGEIHDLIRAGAAVAGGGAYMQPRVEEVGLGDALAVGENVVGPVAGLVLLGENAAAEIKVFGET